MYRSLPGHGCGWDLAAKLLSAAGHGPAAVAGSAPPFCGGVRP